MSYTFQATIDLAAIKQLQLDQPLVVAAVREGRVLGLKRIDLKEVRKIEKIPVDVQFDLPPDENLQGIELRIAPEMPERSLIAFDAFVIQPPAEVIATLKPGASVNLGTYHIPDAIYKPWWIRCSRYHVHGRLVKRVWRQGGFGFCDEPVPGAMVELYDVDRICFWYRKDLITSAETDENGNFSISFLWCCRPWFFRPYDGWIIDRAHWEKLRELLRHLRRIAPRLPIPIPEPDPFTPIVLLNIFETLEKVAQFNQLPVASAAESSLVETGMSSVTPASSIASDLEASSRLLSVKLSPAALRVIQQIRVFCPIWAWRLYGDCRPDLLFRATQPVGGVVRMVYEEEFGNTRWDVPTTPDLNVLLLANEQAMSFNTCVPAAPAGDCLFLSGVGAIQIQDIGDISSGGVLAGYHYRNGPLFPAKPDEPFGGTIRVNGLFGQGTVDVHYYKFQVAPWDGNPANLPSDATFQDVPTAHLEAVYKSYLGIDPVNPALTKPIEVVLGPTLIGGISGLYRSQESVRREYEAAHGGASTP